MAVRKVKPTSPGEDFRPILRLKKLHEDSLKKVFWSD